MRALIAAVGLAALLLPLSVQAQNRAAERPQGTASGTAPGTAPGARAGAEREALIANETGLAVRELYLAPATETEPGPDRLGADTLPHGGTLRLRLGRDRPCQWSVRAVLADETVEERRGVDLCRGGRVLLGDPSVPVRELVVNNDTDIDLREVYAVPSGAVPPAGAPGAPRGPDRLGAEVVPAGGTARIRLGRRRDCTFDVTAVMMDGSEVARPRVDVCRAPRLALAEPGLAWREANVANRAGRVMRSLHIVAGGRGGELETEEGWGAERLGAQPIPDAAARRIRLRLPGCEADLRAGYEDGAAEAKRGVNLCTGTVTFDGSGIPRPPERPLSVINRHGARIDEIYVSSSSDGDWGAERLPGGMARGERQALLVPVECVADIRVVFPGGGAEERREVNICQVPTVSIRPGWTIAARLDEGEEEEDGPRPGSVRLRNTARLPIVELYIDEPGAPRGEDRLGATVLGASETLDVAPPEGGACPARLVAVFRDGREVTRDPFDLCAGTEVPLP